MANIVILSRRTITHPLAGGASVYLHEIFRRLTHRHNITVLSQASDGISRTQEIDGIKYVNFGTNYIRPVLPLKYLTQYSKKADLLVDHGDVAIPWLSPLYSHTPKIAIVHQMVKEIFYYEFGRPVADLGSLVEKIIYKAYTGCPIVAVSSSTANDLYGLGINREHVHIIPPACSIAGSKVPLEDREIMTITCVARMMRYKGLDLALGIFRDLLEKFPSARLELAGSGPHENELRELVMTLGLSDHVHFLGRVSDFDKIKLYQSSRVLLNPSIREGYGISVIEANSYGTPAVGWDVAGMRDSVINGSTGLLAPFPDKEAMSQNIETLLTNDEIWRRLSENSWKWAHSHSWDESAKQFQILIDGTLGSKSLRID